MPPVRYGNCIVEDIICSAALLITPLSKSGAAIFAKARANPTKLRRGAGSVQPSTPTISIESSASSVNIVNMAC